MLMSENEKINQVLLKFNKDRQEIYMTLETERLKDDDLKRQIEEHNQRRLNKKINKKEKHILSQQQHNEMKEKYFKEFTKLQQEGYFIKRQEEEKSEQGQRSFENKKERVLEMRKQREAQKLELQMQLKQKIYDMRIVQWKEQEDNYMERVQKHAEELQRHEEEVARQKEQEKIQMIKEGETFRQKQLKLYEAVKEKEEVIAKKEQVLKINALQQLSVTEEQQKEILKKCNKELLDYQIIQIKRLIYELTQRIKINRIKSLIRQRYIFMNWAKQQVEETKEQGLNLYPLMKTLKL
ncbi:unnamed protein product [Paramecium pentaurelia]|uniref:Trichohyalin-plectin-homology domain-containing protein n=1 Tax=Paramecium pentaurelia TaxID=43138 RepID=A0A8S1U7X0_9CILI|nr:unnamed protein product [Paramecium pentaurelia]